MNNRLGVALALLAATGARASAAEREVLPVGVVPTHYQLLVQPNLDALTFRGTVSITVRVDSPTRQVVLNAGGLTFDHADLDGTSATATANAPLGQETLAFPAAIATGVHVLHIDYHGVISRKTLGVFAMDYDTAAGKRRTLATNFEPASARELLPCWDEPGRKASFSITVDAPADRTAVSNMPVAQTTTLPNGLRRVRFADTPPMSTYLLFLGIGDFERAHRQVDGVDVGVIVKRGDLPKASYALDQAAQLLHYYDNYFGVRFPLPKLDLIAAPGEIDGGSMENWGAIFYSQNHLLLPENGGTDSERQTVFLVVSHEMAHQWFGDLVTMAWWDNLWLNEGFARWMQTYAADALHPEWRTGLRAQEIFESGKTADALPSTHPIVKPVLTAAQAQEAFDDITYDKGAAVITMLHAYAGDAPFRAGVRRYMQAHAFGNAVDADLWKEVDTASGRPISAIERDFTFQDGVPLVTERGDGNVVTLAEARFAADPATIAGSERRWRVPLKLQSFTTGKVSDQLLEPSRPLDAVGPVLINAGQSAYARVAYSEGGDRAVLAHVNALQSVDQLGVLNDDLALGLAGYAPPTRVLAFARGLSADADPVVSERLVRVLTLLDRYYADLPARSRFRSFALGVLRPLSDRLGPTSTAGDAPGVAILRGKLLEAEARFGDAQARAWATGVWGKPVVSSEDAQNALTVVGATADAATFASLQAAAKSEADPLAKRRILIAMAGVQDPALAERMIDIAFSDETPAGGAPEILYTIAFSHPDLVWREAMPRLQASTTLDPNTKWEVARETARGSASLGVIAELEAYEQANVPAEARLPFQGAIASIRQNDRVRRSVLPQLDRWISAQAQGSAHPG